MAEHMILNGPPQKNEIARLLRVLGDDNQKKNLSASATLQNLNSLKSRITSTEAAAPFVHNGVKTLCFYAFDGPGSDGETSQVALTCLANILLLESKTRQIFVETGYTDATVERLRSNHEEELTCSRILFLLTYDTTFNFDDLFDSSSLADSIHENIASHASRYVNARHKIDAASKPPLNDPTLDLKPGALTESLKLLFNLTKLYPNHVHDFTRTITPILEILHNVHLETQPLQPPVSQLINALLNLNISDPANFTSHSTPFFTPPTPNAHISRLIQILDLAIRSSKEEQLESVVPLVTLLRRIYELAPARIEHEMQAQLLPSNEERAQPLGQSDTLASHLLHLTISPLAPNLRESVSCMLFELSSKDATTFVRNVGYGFAAGFLMTHNLPVPENTLEDPGAKLTSVDGQAINPITGQRRDMEPEDPLPEMTDEEKEREAERLFVLFERLKATGVVEVVNPVEAVVGEGRFKEVE